MAPDENKWKRGSKEVAGFWPPVEAASGLGVAKSAPGVMEAKAYGGAGRTRSHMPHTRWFLRLEMFWNKIPGPTPDFRFVIDSGPDPHLGDLITRGGGQNSPSGGSRVLRSLAHFLVKNTLFSGMRSKLNDLEITHSESTLRPLRNRTAVLGPLRVRTWVPIGSAQCRPAAGLEPLPNPTPLGTKCGAVTLPEAGRTVPERRGTCPGTKLEKGIVLGAQVYLHCYFTSFQKGLRWGVWGVVD